MEIQQFRYIVTLYETRNFTKAAEKLYISQSALSQQIKRIEQKLGFVLFQRTTRGLTPTEDCEILIQYANTILRGYNQFMKQCDICRDKKEATIHLYTQKKLNVVNLPRVWAAFHQTHPEITLDFLQPGTLQTKQMIRDACDLAVLRWAECKPYLQSSDYICEKIMIDPLVLIVGEKSPYADHSIVDPKQLNQIKFLMGNKDSEVFHANSNMLSESMIKEMTSNIYTEDYDILAELLQDPALGAFGCRSFGEYYGLRCIPLTVPENNDLYAIYSRYNHNPAIQELVRLLKVMLNHDGSGTGTIPSI